MTKEYTEEQKSVISLVEGQHLVLAPPGSGKTDILSTRVEQALARGVQSKE
ncbi:MAG: UvrD-helicase domain-containing protein [Ignavibacteria bacterium]|nr:UvrD-helicase domain-containing protein [Ignavibacteria bacterium]